MKDIQSSADMRKIELAKAGIKNLQYPIIVLDKVNKVQHTTATVDLFVNLPKEFKGTHMSRFVEAIENWEGEISYKSVRGLLAVIRDRLEACRAQVCFHFPYFIRKNAPATGTPGEVAYNCMLTGELNEKDEQNFILDIEVPVMTVCPCSKAISDEGAHSQRTLVHMTLLMNGFDWIEDFVSVAEASGSSPVYTILKREDEKYVTEHAFANPCFVEDVVRNVAQGLSRNEHLKGYRIEVESMESIHNHNAFACIEYNFPANLR